jgi:hypothetical protein
MQAPASHGRAARGPRVPPRRDRLSFAVTLRRVVRASGHRRLAAHRRRLQPVRTPRGVNVTAGQIFARRRRGLHPSIGAVPAFPNSGCQCGHRHCGRGHGHPGPPGLYDWLARTPTDHEAVDSTAPPAPDRASSSRGEPPQTFPAVAGPTGAEDRWTAAAQLGVGSGTSTLRASLTRMGAVALGPAMVPGIGVKAPPPTRKVARQLTVAVIVIWPVVV